MSQSTNTVVITLLALLFGVAAGFVIMHVARVVAEIPPEDRRYKDPPPFGFRLVWWPIQWLSHPLARVVSQAPASALVMRLRKAGLEYTINAPQFIAGRLLCAFVVAGGIVGLLKLLGHGPSGDFSVNRYWQVSIFGLVCGWAYCGIWLRDRIAVRKRELQKSLPFVLDLITLCVEAGLNLQGAFNQAAEKGPQGILREEIQRVQRHRIHHGRDPGRKHGHEPRPHPARPG